MVLSPEAGPSVEEVGARELRSAAARSCPRSRFVLIRVERVIERDAEPTDHLRGNGIPLRRDIPQDLTDSCHGAVTPCDFVDETAKFKGLRSRMS